VQAVGRYIVEEPFYPLPAAPSPILRGIDVATVPPLFGYNGATLKGAARMALGTPRGDPLLATWQYGLGRTVAWTSDVTGRWAAEWVAWKEFPRFVAQWVGWTLPAPQVEGMNAQVTMSDALSADASSADATSPGGQAVLRVEMTDEAGQPRNFLDVTAVLVDPDLEVQEVGVPQVSAGLYEARVSVGEPGTYLIRVAAQSPADAAANAAAARRMLGQQTLGLVVPYSPEYSAAAVAGTDRRLLDVLARRTGGGELAEPLAAFAHNLPAADSAREVWRGLLLAVALLFPLDVALRRVMLGPGDVKKAWNWARERLPLRRQAAGGEQRALGRLFEARRRVRERTERQRQDLEGVRRPRGRGTVAPTPPEPKESAVPDSKGVRRPSGGGIVAPKPLGPREDEDALARLREAKRRARRER
jgi:Ca-activated chloride channel family protein